MAYFQKRSGSGQVIVKRKGFDRITRTFDTKATTEASFSPERRPRTQPFSKPLIGMSGKSPPPKKDTCKRKTHSGMESPTFDETLSRHYAGKGYLLMA